MVHALLHYMFNELLEYVHCTTTLCIYADIFDGCTITEKEKCKLCYFCGPIGVKKEFSLFHWKIKVIFTTNANQKFYFVFILICIDVYLV